MLQVTLYLLLSSAAKSVALRRCHQATWDEVKTDPAGMSDSNAQELALPPALWRPRQGDYMFEACLGSLMSHYRKGLGCGLEAEHLLRMLKAPGLIPWGTKQINNKNNNAGMSWHAQAPASMALVSGEP